MKVILTGGNGYIGSNLLRKLIYLNYQVDLIVRPQSSLRPINDIIDRCHIYEFEGQPYEMHEIFEKSKPKVVFHLAAHSSYDNNRGNIKSLIESNILLGTQILQAMSDTSVQYLINTGSYWQHKNSLRYNPNSLYAATKESFQNIIQFYTKNYNLKSITLKLFDTYGPNDFRKKILPSLIEAKIKNEKIILSPGNQLIDFVYISDVVDAFIAALNILTSNKKDSVNEKYFISSKQHVRLKSFVNKFINLSGLNIEVKWGGKPYRSREIMVPLKGIPVLPNWKAKVSIDKGLELVKRSLER